MRSFWRFCAFLRFFLFVFFFPLPLSAVTYLPKYIGARILFKVPIFGTQKMLKTWLKPIFSMCLFDGMHMSKNSLRTQYIHN